MDKVNRTVFIISFLISIITINCFASIRFNNQKELLFFYADWCPPCKVIHRELLNKNSAIQPILSKYTLTKINIDLDKDLVSMYNISAVPTFVILDNGKELSRMIGTKNGVSDLILYLLENQ